MIFKNWLDTRPKMETHDPNVYPTILGGVSRGFWTPFLDRGARSAIFWHMKTPKVPVFTCQKKAIDIWVMRFHFRASIKPIFENHVFRAVWSPFYPLKRPKNENGLPRIVYGSINLKIVFWGLKTNLQVPQIWRSKIQTFFVFGTGYCTSTKWGKQVLHSVVRNRASLAFKFRLLLTF